MTKFSPSKKLTFPGATVGAPLQKPEQLSEQRSQNLLERMVERRSEIGRSGSYVERAASTSTSMETEITVNELKNGPKMYNVFSYLFQICFYTFSKCKTKKF